MLTTAIRAILGIALADPLVALACARRALVTEAAAVATVLVARPRLAGCRVVTAPVTAEVPDLAAATAQVGAADLVADRAIAAAVATDAADTVTTDLARDALAVAATAIGAGLRAARGRP
ncbi:MAG: hypothetical protein M3Z20_18940, partial [Chloroflexota bacterium]|nr:hypothetical protein [Chloroflexota bacterium]